MLSTRPWRQAHTARCPNLGVGHGVVSRLEHRADMLLATLYGYIMAPEPRALAQS
jgi:hypothetical protein